MRAITIITYGNEYWEAKMTTTKKLPAWKTYEFPNQQANFMWNMGKTIQTHGIQTYRYSCPNKQNVRWGAKEWLQHTK